MILGLDIRASACGWSLLDETASSFVDLGVHALGHPERLTTLSRAGRHHGLAVVVAERAQGCSAIVVERWPPGVLPVDIALAWGSILGVAAMLSPRPRLLTLEPYQWQAEVLLGREMDEELAYAYAEHILRSHPRAEAALARLARREREPAIAAAMIALCGELRLSKHKRVA